MPSVFLLDWMFATIRVLHYVTNTQAENPNCDYVCNSDVTNTVGRITETIFTEKLK